MKVEDLEVSQKNELLENLVSIVKKNRFTDEQAEQVAEQIKFLHFKSLACGYENAVNDIKDIVKGSNIR